MPGGTESGDASIPAGDTRGGHVPHPPTDLLLLVATDRVSAFDVVMNERVPDKGRVLTQLTAWWLGTHLRDIPHHLVSVRPEEIRGAVPELAQCRETWEGRATLVRRTHPLPVECVVRGYLSGSAWKEYRESGTLAGEPLPAGLAESDALVPAIYSPSTKAREGHDENITFAQVGELLGAEPAARLCERSLDIYERGRRAAAAAGHHPRRHQVRVRHLTGRRATPDRRGADPRFVPLLASGALRTGEGTAIS